MIALSRRRRWRIALHNLRDRIQRLRALRRSRLDLARLDLHLLDDVALTPREQQREAARRLWDAPDSWRDHGTGWR